MSARPDRLPPIPRERMTAAQRQAADAIAAGTRGALYGPFVPLLRSPEFMNRLQHTGEYLRYHAALPPRLREMLILLTARHHGQGFEWSVHQPLALAAGLAPAIAEAIAENRRPEAMAEDEAALWDFALELRLGSRVSDPTYARALALFGEQGVVDLVGIVGYYGLLALILNVAGTPPAPGTAPPLPG